MKNPYNNNNSEIWKAISENYKIERETISFPSLLIDQLVLELLGSNAKMKTVLDFGSGSGTLSRLVADKFNVPVIAYEPMEEMMDAFHELTPESKYPGIHPLTTQDDVIHKSGDIDTILCINVLDHVLNVEKTLNFFNSLVDENDRLILSIPHPLKNLGHWVKEKVNGEWKYHYYKLDDYLQEGEICRNREDIDGNLIIESVVSQHRTISTYYNLIQKCGFHVQEMYEPKPEHADLEKYPILYTQSIRIPYFWILDCIKTTTSNKQLCSLN